MNSVRYYFALALVMYTQKYVLRGEYGKFLLWVLLGCTIHKSVLLVIPAYIVIDLLSRIRLKKWHYAVGVLLILSLIFGQDVYRNIIFRFYPYYKGFHVRQRTVILCQHRQMPGSADTVPDLLEGQRSGKSQKPLLLLPESGGTGGLFLRLLYPGSIPKVAYYLIQSQIFLIPGVLKDAKKGWFRTLCIIGVVAAYLLYFVMLLRGMYDVEIRLLPYLNWIFN